MKAKGISLQPLISVEDGSQKFQNISETAPSPILSISNYCFSLLFFKFFGVGGEVVVHP
jgi:hypothetical protein